MNILITGGLGFIGSHLVDNLIKKKHKIFVIDNLSTGIKKNLNRNAKYFYYDLKSFISDNTKLNNFLRKYKIKVVYHLAANASVNASQEKPMNMINENFNSSVSLVESCKNTNVKKFIFASTSAVYGEPIYLPVDESHPKRPISIYGLSKYLFENYLKFYSKKSEISSIILRLPNVYGPRQRTDLEGGVIAIFNNKLKSNKKIVIYGTGKQKRDWVHVYDIVEAFTNSLKYRSNYEIFSIGSGIGFTVNKLFKLLCKKYNYEKKPIMKSARPGDILNMIMKFEKAKRKLKWKPKLNFSKGIELID